MSGILSQQREKEPALYSHANNSRVYSILMLVRTLTRKIQYLRVDKNKGLKGKREFTGFKGRITHLGQGKASIRATEICLHIT